jgi:hypothetical protein
VISKTGISDLIGQTEGTVFIDFNWIGQATIASRLFQINNGTSSSDIFFNVFGVNNQIQLFINNILVYDFLINANDVKKLAIVYTINSVKLFVNGINVFTTTGVFNFVLLDRLNIGSSNTTGSRISHYEVKKFLIYKTALTEQECINLTTI